MAHESVTCTRYLLLSSLPEPSKLPGNVAQKIVRACLPSGKKLTSRLIKTVRKIFRIPPRPRRTAPDCVREGHIYRLTHATYGPLKILAEDQAISWHVIDGRSVWEADLVKIFQREIRG